MFHKLVSTDTSVFTFYLLLEYNELRNYDHTYIIFVYVPYPYLLLEEGAGESPNFLLINYIGICTIAK